MKRTLATVLAILLPTPFSAAAQSTSTGLTGLGEMRTPDTIPDNAGEITIVPARYSVISNGLNESTRTKPSLGYTQGIGRRFEVGVVVPFLMHEFRNSDSDSGIANVPVMAKYRFLDWNRFRFAGDAGLEIPASSKEDEYGTGALGYSAHLLGTMDVNPVVFSGSLGYASTDSCARCSYAGPGGWKPESAPVLSGAAGMSFSTQKGYGAFVELQGANAYSEAGEDGKIKGDPDLYALLGGRVPIGRSFAVTGYGGAGVVEGGSNTQAVGALMLHYSFAASRPLARSTYGSSRTAVAAATPAPVSGSASASAFCTKCGSALPHEAKFCGTCGAKRAAAPNPVAVAVAVATPAPTPVAVVTPVPVATLAPTPAPTPVAVVAPLRRTLTAPQLALKAKMEPSGQFLFEGVTFSGPTGALLAPASSATLSDLAAVLQSHPEAKLRIEAHVDPTDPNALQGSQLRADAIVAKLKTLGANATQLEAKGMGGTKSLFPSFVEAMKAKNRRVEIGVLAPPADGAGGGSAAVVTAPQSVTGNARVKVLAAKGNSARAVKLANELKAAGTKVTTIANMVKTQTKSEIYYTPAFRFEAEQLAKQIPVTGAKLTPYKTLGAGIDIVLVVGSDMK